MVPIQVKYCYSKRNESTISMGLKRSPLGRQKLSAADYSHAPPCNGQEFEVGAFYEIDHDKLPPKSPIQLKTIRIVKVSEATSLDVTVSFPSTLSLRNYYSYPSADDGPELDERFVMSSNQAGKILRRLVSTSELDREKHLESFWLMAPRSYELQSSAMFPSTAVLADAEEVQNPQNLISSCLLTLQCSGAMGWGIRRKVRYIGRHREMLYQKGKGKSEYKEEDVLVDEEEEEVVEVEEKRRRGRKRKRESTRKDKIKKKKKKNKRKELKKPKHEKNNKRNCDDEQRVKGSKDRWSLERYESAEMKLLEIMREKGAELGNPILRQALREEARKHIGDTGLLDHLLKHMAGKIVTDGRERFRRRHNAEGAMEYWLEPADLVEIRRNAGVMDPYWVPPPGWQPGDAASPFPYGPGIKKEIDELRKELTSLKREMEQVSSLKHVEKMAFDAQSQVQNVSCTWQDKYERLLKQNSKREEEIAAMSRSLLALKEEIYLLKQGKMKLKDTEVAAVTEDNAMSEGGSKKKGEEKRKMETGHKCTNNSNISIQADGSSADKSANNNNKDNSSVGDGANRNGGSSCIGGKKATRKSGFRICKPQGTFLWPNMAGGTNLTTGSCRAATTSEDSSPRPQGMMVPTTNYATMTMTTSSLVSLEEHLMMFGGEPTPPSVSSTSAPPKLLLPSPTSPVQQLQRPPFANVFVGPTYALHHLHQQQQSQGLGLARQAPPPQLQERTASSDNISSPVYYHHQIPNEVSPSQQLPRGASPREGRKEGVSLRTAPWKPDNGGATSGLSTDLALAIPSSYC
ncbi:protein AMEIOTIC 1 homolog [Typha angustifolia]|uniref:protein AMEIOTIC 1 homolog n=1 Tax=Typha angustifolia TaxID=59011 RepID=UPI003C2BDAE3